MSTLAKLLGNSGLPEQPFACSRRTFIHSFIHGFYSRWGQLAHLTTTEACKILLLLQLPCNLRSGCLKRAAHSDTARVLHVWIAK